MGSVDKIETFGLVDGPGIRTVIFLSGCKLRCKYCQNPEMWKRGKDNYTPQELAAIILKNKPYFKRGGGVTFSGGEPLLQSDFIIDVAKILKKDNIHIAIDTAGVGGGNYKEILSYVDLVLLDIKHVEELQYQDLTGYKIDEYHKFRDELNKSGKEVIIRQVIVPHLTDSIDYLNKLAIEVKKIKNVSRIEFLPYHTLGKEKYHKLNIPYPYEELEAMDKIKCEELYKQFLDILKDNKS